jgi:hypothetical protein
MFLISCSSSPAEIVANHLKPRDEYVQNEKFKEAVIEYKNAVKEVPVVNYGKQFLITKRSPI